MTPNEVYHRWQKKKNPNYRVYRRRFEKKYREVNRIMWNFKSWKSTQRKAGKRITYKKEFIYLVDRILKKELLNERRT